MQTKIKLTFRREYNRLSGGGVKYRLDSIENAVTVKLGNRVATTTYRAGDIVPELDVQEFVESKRDYEVKVKS